MAIHKLNSFIEGALKGREYQGVIGSIIQAGGVIRNHLTGAKMTRRIKKSVTGAGQNTGQRKKGLTVTG